MKLLLLQNENLIKVGKKNQLNIFFIIVIVACNVLDVGFSICRGDSTVSPVGTLIFTAPARLTLHIKRGKPTCKCQSVITGDRVRSHEGAPGSSGCRVAAETERGGADRGRRDL